MAGGGRASFIVFRLPAYHANIRKRLVRSPKLYFHDVGLASYLLGIESPNQVATHPLRGALFENIVVTEALKHGFNRGSRPSLSFYRDSKGLGCDLLYETGRRICAIEAKSGATVAADYFRSINRVAELLPAIASKTIVFGGAEGQLRSDCLVVPLGEFAGRLERLGIEQEVSSFVERRLGPEPDRSDVDVLDAVCQRYVRPILEGLEPGCRQLGHSLLSRFETQEFARRGNHRVNGMSLLDAGPWKRTKEQYIIDRGFALSDEHPVELGKEYSFNGYTGKSKRGFGVNL